MYKMIAVDMDGTLLNSKHQLSQENLEALKKAQELGVKVIPITARAYNTIDDVVKLLNLQDAVGTQTGSIVIDPKDESVLFSNLIPAKVCKSIFEYAQQEGYLPMLHQNDKVFTKMKGKYLDIFETTMDMKVDYIEDVFDIYNGEAQGKILFMDEPAKLNKLYDWLIDQYEDEIFPAFSFDFALELCAVSKGQMMLKIADHFGILPSEIIAIGDGQNDVDMLEKAGFGVAMENAMDELKTVADFVTRSNDESGVAYAVNKLILATY